MHKRKETRQGLWGIKIKPGEYRGRWHNVEMIDPGFTHADFLKILGETVILITLSMSWF